MPLEHSLSTTLDFQPTGEAKRQKMTATESIETSSSDILPKPQSKAKRKRAMSTTPPAPAMKKPNLDTSTSDTLQKHFAYNDLPSDWLPDLSTPDEGSQNVPKSLQLTYHIGDMFADAPGNSMLIHACNTQGHWGAGIAKAFKIHYPKAYAAHHKFCAKEHNKTNSVPTGTAQLLAPVDDSSEHWIGCLFTSAKYGKAKDKPDAIVKNTVASMKMLLELVKTAGDDSVTEIRMCKINSGKFGVPWEKTEEALQGIVLQEGWRGSIEVWEP